MCFLPYLVEKLHEWCVTVVVIIIIVKEERETADQRVQREKETFVP